MTARVIFARIMWRFGVIMAVITIAITASVIINQHINTVDRKEQNLQQQINAMQRDINAIAHGLHVVIPVSPTP